jgi:hypothetical protein
VSWFGLRWGPKIPPALTRVLGPEEHLTGIAPTQDGRLLAVSRFGLWLVDGERAERWDWHLISRARLADRVLHLTVADEIDHWPDDTAVLTDRPEVQLRPERLTRLTDAVHGRVRRSVAASRHLSWPGGGGWVVLRRVPGRDGLVVQVRLDPGADPAAPGFADAVADAADEMWPATVRPRHPGPA